MRFILLVVVATLAFSTSILAQSENPFDDALDRKAVLKVAENDNQPASLLKRSINAAHNEMRIRYNYWVPGIGEVDGLIASIDQLHRLRGEIDTTTSELEFIEQKLRFVKEVESHCEKAGCRVAGGVSIADGGGELEFDITWNERVRDMNNVVCGFLQPQLRRQVVNLRSPKPHLMTGLPIETVLTTFI